MTQIPKTCSAAILVAQKSPLVVDEVELPSEPGIGQVVVRVAHSGICGSQIGEIDGAKGDDLYLPHLLGHEGSGHVLSTGPGVTTVGVGDRVVLHWRPGTGIAGQSTQYRWRDERLNAGPVTTFSEYAVVSENRVTPVPDDLPLDAAALLGCAATTGFGVISNDAGLLPGEATVVFGAGGVGLSVIQAATMVAAHPLIAVDLFETRLQLACELGASHCILGGTATYEDAVREALGGVLADVCIETTGNREVIETAIRLAGRSGRVVLVGVPRPESAISLHTLQLHFGKRLIGSHGGSATPADDIPRLVRLVRAGKLDLGRLVTRHYPLHQVNEAIAAMRSGELQGRCLLDMGT